MTDPCGVAVDPATRAKRFPAKLTIILRQLIEMLVRELQVRCDMARRSPVFLTRRP
jgi:hypothetical protein